MEKAKEEVESSRVFWERRERNLTEPENSSNLPPCRPFSPELSIFPIHFTISLLQTLFLHHQTPPNSPLPIFSSSSRKASYNFPLHRSSCSIAVNSNTEPPPHARSNGRDTIVTDLRPRTHPPLHSWSQYALKTIRLRVMLTI